jgi:triphosphatase
MEISMPEGQEIELKFLVDPSAVGKLEQALVVRPKAKAAAGPEALESTYYDTAASSLQRAGFVLRVRQVGSKRIQTVKSDAEGLSVRGEWETELTADGLDLDFARSTPLGPVLKGLHEPLLPIFATRIQRAKHLVRQGKARIEAAIDRGAVTAGEASEDVCELELELKDGPPQALYDLARRLAKAAPMRLSFVSKAERGYRLRRGKTVGEAVKQGKVKLKPGMTVRQAVRLIAASGLRQWVANAEVLRSARRPEALHQMRVGLRRLRSGLKLFEDGVGDAAYPKLVAELKWLAGELDGGRDIDVMIAETFRPAAEAMHDQAGMAGLGERLAKARGKAYDRVVTVIDQPRYHALVLDMAAWIDAGAWSDPADPVFGPRADQPVETVAKAALDALRRQVKKRGKSLKTLDPERRHKLRIRAKRLRYALEFFGGLYDGKKSEHEATLAVLKSLQDGLGQLNDMKVARDKGLALAEGGGRAAGDSEIEGHHQAYVAGLITGLRLTGEADLIDQAVDRYDAFVNLKPFWR